MKRAFLLLCFVLLFIAATAANTKPRIIVMTDSEIDDRCSMVR